MEARPESLCPGWNQDRAMEGRGTWSWLDLVGLAWGGDGSIQEPLLMEHPRTTGQSQVQSESSEEDMGFTVDSVGKARGCKIFPLSQCP